jgi:hypothetical protein
MGKKSMYEVQNSILKKDFIPTDEELKSLNSFLICRWLSSHPYTIEISNFINSNYDLPIKAQYWFARSFVSKVKYIILPKKEKEDLTYIEIIAKEYECNLDLARRYMNILPKSEIDRIYEKWTRGGKSK